MAGVESDRTGEMPAARWSGVVVLGLVVVACSTESLTPRDSAANQSVDAPTDTTSQVGIVVDAAPVPVDGQAQLSAGSVVQAAPHLTPSVCTAAQSPPPVPHTLAGRHAQVGVPEHDAGTLAQKGAGGVQGGGTQPGRGGVAGQSV
jgi:hypothetical protein